ncbi:MAG: metallophosphoesterase [Bacteroidales bacterium]|nr:metallophosphoesterase [Bacteroidales bacterium]
MRYAFFLILLLPIAAQAFVTWRLWQLLPVPVCVKVLLALVMAMCFIFSLLAFMPLLDRLSMPAATIVYQVGTSWLMILLYLVMCFVALELFRLCHIVPLSFLRASWSGSLVVIGLIGGTFVYGYLHYINKVRVKVELPTNKSMSSSLRVVMTSDWHLGYHNRRAELSRWIDLINAEAPDLVLIAGDIIDRSIRPLDEEDMAQEFHRLHAPVYACLGNHEYYSGEPQALRFYREAGIHLLRDSVVSFGDLIIIGRDDRTNPRRRLLKELTAGIDSSKYIILLDHQPYHLEQAEKTGIDFELAGHTHHGQVWPVSWITDKMYECAYGDHQRGATRYYVSSGLGIWGGKFRIGTQSEYVVAEIKPQ